MPLKDKQTQVQYQGAWLKARRLAWISEQGGRCFYCASQESLIVTYTDWKKKTVQVSSIWSLKKEKRDALLALCHVVCSACQKKKWKLHFKYRMKHGATGYDHYHCRCDVCCEAKAIVMDRYRENRKQRRRAISSFLKALKTKPLRNPENT